MSAPPPSPSIPRAIWVLIASAFVVAVGYGIITPVLPQFARSFDVGVREASIVVSAFAFFRLVGAPGAGRLVTRLGERWVYITGVLIVAASTAATAFAHSYWQLVLYRSLGGLGSTMFTISSTALLIRLAPPSIRGRVTSAYASAFLIGNIAGPILGGLLGGLGLRIPFLVYAAGLVVAAGIVWARLPSPGPPGGVHHALPAPMTVREAWGDSAFRGALVAAFANGWSSFGVRVALVPLFAAATLGAGPAVAGWALASFAVGNAAVLSFSGPLSDRVGRRPLLRAGLAVNGVATMWVGASGSVPTFLVLSFVAGAGAGLFYPALQATVADVIGSDRSGGSVLAVNQMVMDSGAIIGPILSGWLVDRSSFSVAFAVTGAITLVALGVWVFARESRVGAGAPVR